ncbi:hypothetical protein CPB84DRAFT_986315 [Gymnopilus junonius]|uniref:Uncharacterized protein n=1 Tax=Gymnopilus junonius TaxID=109634 RepID=A0A9P5NNI4_GYMJU|nr:hypothetical protein CPB84DRAFT_986315 [Gymnopilus junonius]
MGGSQTADALYGFVLSVLRTIHAIEFAMEWAALPQASKTRFRHDAFNRLAPNMTFKVFQHRHEKIIKARNDLKKLFVKFGVSVLMDPCWAPQVAYDTGRTGRSATFSATMRELLKQTRDVELVESEGAFRQLMGALTGGQTLDFIHNFMMVHCTSIDKNKFLLSEQELYVTSTDLAF